MQNGLDTNPSQNSKRLINAEAAAPYCTQEQTPSQHADADAGIAESDDSDNCWTDVSSDDDKSDFSDSSASNSGDSCGCSDRKAVSGKRQSQHSHSASSVLTCSGEKLVRIFHFYYCVLYI